MTTTPTQAALCLHPPPPSAPQNHRRLPPAPTWHREPPRPCPGVALPSWHQTFRCGSPAALRLGHLTPGLALPCPGLPCPALAGLRGRLVPRLDATLYRCTAVPMYACCTAGSSLWSARRPRWVVGHGRGWGLACAPRLPHQKGLAAIAPIRRDVMGGKKGSCTHGEAAAAPARSSAFAPLTSPTPASVRDPLTCSKPRSCMDPLGTHGASGRTLRPPLQPPPAVPTVPAACLVEPFP